MKIVSVDIIDVKNPLLPSGDPSSFVSIRTKAFPASVKSVLPTA